MLGPLGPAVPVFPERDFGGTKVSCFLGRDVNPASTFGGVFCSGVGYRPWAVDVVDYFVHVPNLPYTHHPVKHYFKLFYPSTFLKLILAIITLSSIILVLVNAFNHP